MDHSGPLGRSQGQPFSSQGLPERSRSSDSHRSRTVGCTVRNVAPVTINHSYALTTVNHHIIHHHQASLTINYHQSQSSTINGHQPLTINGHQLGAQRARLISGPIGSGKSTLLEALTGTRPPLSGLCRKRGGGPGGRAGGFPSGIRMMVSGEIRQLGIHGK